MPEAYARCFISQITRPKATIGLGQRVAPVTERIAHAEAIPGRPFIFSLGLTEGRIAFAVVKMDRVKFGFNDRD